MSDQAYVPPPVKVLDLDIILFLPLRFEPLEAELIKARSNPELQPSVWLTQFARAIESASAGTENSWRYLPDPFAEKFGFPDLYSTDAKRFAEFAYFHPFIQRVLYERDPNARPMAVLARNDVRQLAVKLNDSTEVKAQVKRAQMFLFTTELALVAVQLHIPGSHLQTLDPKAALSLTFNFPDQVRRVYTPYWNGDHPGQTPLTAFWLDAAGNQIGVAGDYRCQAQIGAAIDSRRPPMIGHWQSLVAPWLDSANSSPGPIAFHQLGDERCHTMVYLSVDRPHDLADYHQYRIAFLDEAGTDWAYNPKFLRAQADQIFYDRFWERSSGWMNTRYLSTGYSFVLLRDAFPSADYLHDHFQSHYFFLNLLALMQKCSLLIAWQRLSDIIRIYASADQSPEKRKDFHRDQKWLSEDVAEYVALFEFSQVSNQLQALELFSMIRANLQCDRLFAEVMRQIEFARSVEQVNYEERVQNRAQKLASEQTRLSNIAAFWLPVALTLSFLGMSVGMDDFNYWIHHVWNPSGSALILWRVFLAFIIVAGVAGLFYVLFRFFPKKQSDTEAADPYGSDGQKSK